MIKMKKVKVVSFIFVAFAFLAFLNACNKAESILDFGEDTAISDDVSDALFDDAFNEADAFSDGNSYKSASVDSCQPVVTIVVDSTSDNGFPRTITVDFGDSYCDAKNGRQRKGKLIITQSAPRYTVGASRSITFENYFVNDYKIEGTQSVTFNGKDDNGFYSWTWKLIGGVVSTPDGLTLSRDAENTRTLIEGADTRRNRWDDVWKFSGSASGVNGNGVAYTRTIDAENPIVRPASCHFATKGSVTIEREGKSNATLDYGDGTCDDKATIEVDGETKEISLKKVFR